MRLYLTESPKLSADDIARFTSLWSGVVFDCGECGSADTVEVDELVPAGTMHKVRCERGHVSVGTPPTLVNA
ncbi:MAG: hypothetical protein EKK42_20185 [Pseudonocardiaceae bacterium]|nr:MAG: hypothetical protein EKK42_20185 [Pseudonocardiaceae bacterium]